MKINPIKINNTVRFRNIQPQRFVFKGLIEPQKDSFEKSIQMPEKPQNESTINWEEIRKSADKIVKNPADSKKEIENIEKYASGAIEKAQNILEEYKAKFNNESNSPACSANNEKTLFVKNDDFHILTYSSDECAIEQIMLYEPKENSYLLIDYENGIKIRAIGDKITQYYEGYSAGTRGSECWANRISYIDGRVNRITQNGSFDTFEDSIITAKKELVLGINEKGELVPREYYGRNFNGIPSWNKISNFSYNI